MIRALAAMRDKGFRWFFLARAITLAGPVPVAQYMAAANAHYYATRDPLGTTGDFTTAPEISQMFGELLGLWCADLWDRAGRPDVAWVELGPGRGTLAADALRARPEVAGKIAAIGYCFGGQLAYRAAATGKIDAAVAYYGGGIQNALDLAGKITQPILFHYAEDDHAIPLTAVDQVKAAFAGHGDASFHVYPGAEHGFNCTDRASYNQRASALAHGRTLTFLAEHL